MNEALKCLSFLKDEAINDIACLKDSVTTKTLYQLYFANFDTIEQALLKAQKIEEESKQLEKELNCPLEVVAYLVMNRPFYYKDKNDILHQISTYDLINKKLIFYLNWEDVNMYEDIELPLSSYGRTFWLKSEHEEEGKED